MENNTFEYVVPCHFGMEAVLKREIMALGYEIVNVAVSRVQKARRVGCLICAILLVPDVSSGPGGVKRQGQKSIRPVL